MRRPLAFVCSLIVVTISLLVYAGILPFGKKNTLPEDGKCVTVSGRVDEIYEKYIVLKVNEILQEEPDHGSAGTEQTCTRGRVLLAVYFREAPALHLGEAVTVRGRFECFSHAMNPGQFDAHDYYTSKGYEGKLSDSELITRDGCIAPIREPLRQLRLRMKARIYKVCPDKEASVLCDLLLGDKEGLDKETKELYQNNGIAHILSISGLHISILGIGCFGLLRKLRCRKIPAAIASAVFLTLYLVMTGMSVSATRAVGMFVIRMLAFPAKRTEDPLTSLSLMAAIVLILDPASIRNVSFLLSYGAALGIYTFLPAIDALLFSGEKKERFYEEDTLKNRIRNLSKKAASATLHSLAASLAITLFTLPIQLYFFYKVSIYAVFLNLLILPCMSLLVFSGMIMLVPGLGFVSKISCLLLNAFEFLCRLSEKLPHHTWNPGRPGKLFIIIYYLIVLALTVAGRLIIASRNGYILRMLPYFSKKGKRRITRINSITEIADTTHRRSASVSEPAVHLRPTSASIASLLRPAFLLTSACFALMIFLLRFPLPVRNSCTQLYVGQGNCNVMITDAGEVYMFDGGSSSEKNCEQYIILPFLRYSGLSTIDGIFISHSDEDHINGIQELIENSSEQNLRIRGIYITPQMRSDGTENTAKLISSCEAAGVPVISISAGSQWESGTTHFACLHPDTEFLPEDPNSGSMCILAEFNCGSSDSNLDPLQSPSSRASFSLLLPGDAQGAGESALTAAIADYLAARPLDVYITAHHGSSGTTTEDFLEACRPRLAINSAGLNNSYGHPHPETLARLENAGCAHLTTYETGAVTLVFTETDIQIQTFNP